MGWLLFLGGIVVSIFKTIFKAIVWTCKGLLNVFWFAAKVFFSSGFGWIFLYALIGGIMYLAGWLDPNSVQFMFFLWGLIPVGLLTMLSVFLKIDKRQRNKYKDDPQPKAKKIKAVQTNKTPVEILKDTPSSEFIGQYRDIVSENVIVFEYTDRYEKYLLLPEGKKLIEIVQKVAN